MERGSGGTVRCRSPWGAGPEGSRRRGSDPARPLGGVERRGTKAPAGRLLSARLGSARRAGLGWAGSAFPHGSPGRAGSDGAEPPPAHCCLRGGGVRRQPAPCPPVPVPIAPAVSTGTTSAAEPPRLPPAPAFLARHGQARGGGRREQTSPLPQPGRWRRRHRGSWSAGGREGGGEGAAPGAPGRGPPAAAGRGLMLRGAGWRRVGSLPGPEQLSCPGRSALGLLARGEPLGSCVAQSGQCKDGKAAGYSE